MNQTCSICKKSDHPRQLVRLYEDSYEEIHRHNLYGKKVENVHVHPICASFFPNIDLIIVMSATNPCLLPNEEGKVVMEGIFCNFKEISKYSEEKCKICDQSQESEVLIPCQESECQEKFDLACVMSRDDIEKMKLIKSDSSTFKYGILCPKHSQDQKDKPPMKLKADCFKIYRQIGISEIREELGKYEDMIGNINSLIKNDLELNPITDLLRVTKESMKKSRNREGRSKKFGKWIKPRRITKPIQNGNTDEEHKLDINGEAFQRKRSVNGKLKGKNQEKLVLEEHDSLMKEKEPKNNNRRRSKSNKFSVVSNRKMREILEGIAQQNPNKINIEVKELKSKETNQNSNELPKTIISLRKTNPQETQNYNLRGEIKTASKLMFETLQDSRTNKTKATPEQNQIMSSEDKKKQYWTDFNETYWRKPYFEEVEPLMPVETDPLELEIESLRKKDTSPVNQEAEEQFDPFFEAIELRGFTKPFLQRDTLPNETLKILFEYKKKLPSNVKQNHAFLGYFRMKNKARDEIVIPEDLSALNSDHSKYLSVPSHDYQKTKEVFKEDLKPFTYKSEYIFSETSLNEDLGIEGYHKLFGLKQLHYLKPDDLMEMKTKMMIEKEYDFMKDENTENTESNFDDLSKEIIYAQYLLQNFIVPENNVSKEKLTYTMREDDAFLRKNSIKLHERMRTLDSDSRFAVIKKYFQYGFEDKTSNFVTRGYVRDAKDQIVSELTFVPKIDKGSNIIKIFKEKKPLSIVETDCCICFYNQFTEFNPIIYCSNCNMSFHKFCYGLLELPSEDFFCEVCFASVDPNMRKKKAVNQAKLKNSLIPTQVVYNEKNYRCGICGIKEYPLKRFRRAGWFHITCLVLHDIIRLRYCEWIVRTEKSDLVDHLKSNPSLFECSICKGHTGITIKCNCEECPKYFHAMCAYVNGYALEITRYEGKKEDDGKSGLIPLVYCNEHSKEQNRDLFKQQYFRRYTTNFKNTLIYETFEDYVKLFNEEEEESPNTTQAEEIFYGWKTPSLLETNDTETSTLKTINIEQSVTKILRREPEISSEDLEESLIGGPIKKTKKE